MSAQDRRVLGKNDYLLDRAKDITFGEDPEYVLGAIEGMGERLVDSALSSEIELVLKGGSDGYVAVVSRKRLHHVLTGCEFRDLYGDEVPDWAPKGSKLLRGGVDDLTPGRKVVVALLFDHDSHDYRSVLEIWMEDDEDILEKSASWLKAAARRVASGDTRWGVKIMTRGISFGSTS